MDITSFFIPAPLSFLLTILFCASLVALIDFASKSLFTKPKLWLRSLSFFAGLLVLSWLITSISVASMISVVVLNWIFWTVLLGGIPILIYNVRCFHPRDIAKLLPETGKGRVL